MVMHDATALLNHLEAWLPLEQLKSLFDMLNELTVSATANTLDEFMETMP